MSLKAFYQGPPLGPQKPTGEPDEHDDLDPDAIMEERGKVYGTIYESFGAIAKSWEAQLTMANGFKVRVRPEDVALCMAQLKVIRSCKVFHEDNYVDGVNYFRIARDLAFARMKEEHDG